MPECRVKVVQHGQFDINSRSMVSNRDEDIDL